MYSPGYYKTNYGALSFKGVARMRGWLRSPLAYLITRFKQPTPAAWMPQTWADLECSERELSDRIFQATAGPREKFRQLEFTELGFKKLRRILNPHLRDNGGINYLDRSRCHFGQLIYNKSRIPPPVNADQERIVVAFTAVFPRETLSYTNNRKTPFEALPSHKVVRIPSNDVAHIYERFLTDLKRRKEPPRQFPDLQSLKDWFDANARAVFEDRARRGLLIRMSDEEVAAARRKLPPPLPNT